jgi:hypothetical protein
MDQVHVFTLEDGHKQTGSRTLLRGGTSSTVSTRRLTLSYLAKLSELPGIGSPGGHSPALLPATSWTAPHKVHLWSDQRIFDRGVNHLDNRLAGAEAVTTMHRRIGAVRRAEDYWR